MKTKLLLLFALGNTLHADTISNPYFKNMPLITGGEDVKILVTDGAPNGTTSQVRGYSLDIAQAQALINDNTAVASQIASNDTEILALQNQLASSVDNDTQLTEAQVDTFVANNGYITTDSDTDVTALSLALTGTDLTASVTESGTAINSAALDLSGLVGTDDQDASEVPVANLAGLGTDAQAALEGLNDADIASAVVKRKDGQLYNILEITKNDGSVIEVPDVKRILTGVQNFTLNPSLPNAGDNFIALNHVDAYLSVCSVRYDTPVTVSIADGVYFVGDLYGHEHSERIIYKASTPRSAVPVSGDDEAALRGKYNVVFESNSSRIIDRKGGFQFQDILLVNTAGNAVQAYNGNTIKLTNCSVVGGIVGVYAYHGSNIIFTGTCSVSDQSSIGLASYTNAYISFTNSFAYDNGSFGFQSWYGGSALLDGSTISGASVIDLSCNSGSYMRITGSSYGTSSPAVNVVGNGNSIITTL